MKTLFAVVLFGAAAAGADTIYKWVDKDGEEHFTNDPASIPPGQKTTITEGAELNVISVARPEKTNERPKPATKPAPAEPVEDKDADRKAYETSWRGRFKEARAKVANLSALVAQDQQKYDQLKEVSASVTVTNTAYGATRQQEAPAERAREQLKQDQEQLRAAQEALDDLERAASREAVPRAWRSE